MRGLPDIGRAGAGGAPEAASSSSGTGASGFMRCSHSSSSDESVARTSSPSHVVIASDLVRAVLLGDGLPQRAVGLGQIPQHHALGALQACRPR